MSERRIYIVAGEASGDLHAAALVTALRDEAPEWRFVGLGGEAMAAAGVELRENLVDRSVMGIWNVVGSIGMLVDVAARFLDEMRRDPPDLLILVDYPGLNLNLARLAQKRGIPVAYYICPQVWAWAPWRLRRVASRADLLLVILPFEENLYRTVHSRVHYVGNPVFDHLAEVEERLAADDDGTDGDAGSDSVALLPGSRRHEVSETLPVMLDVWRELAQRDGDLRPVVSCHRPRLEPFIDAALKDAGVDAEVVLGDAHRLQRNSLFSLIVSGTATLEQAFFGTPMVVLYPGRSWELALYRLGSVTPFISLVNLFAGKRVVPEFLFTPGDNDPVKEAAVALLDADERRRVRDELTALRERHFRRHGARRAARHVVEFLAEKR